MSATLKLTHKAIGAEVRRGTYDVVAPAPHPARARAPEARGVQPGTPSRRLTGIFAGFALAAHGR